jgi:hypothetical protein
MAGLILPWPSHDAAIRFRDYLLSDEGRQLLASHGSAFRPGKRMDWVAVGLTLKLAALTTLIWRSSASRCVSAGDDA